MNQTNRGNLYRESIQSAAREALAANIDPEQIRQWVDEVTVNAVDYYPGMTQCAELSTP